MVVIDANVDRSTSCMESQFYPYLNPPRKTLDVTKATNTPSHDWTLEFLSMYEPHISSPRATSTLSSPILGYAATQPSIGDI